MADVRRPQVTIDFVIQRVLLNKGQHHVVPREAVVIAWRFRRTGRQCFVGVS
jgi:hypothetical protein